VETKWRSCGPVEHRPGRAEEWGPEEWRSHGLKSSGSRGLSGGAWWAASAVLLVNCGMEKPSMS
jgi:hypothetical protein